MTVTVAYVALLGSVILAPVGAAGAWLAHRRTRLASGNFYLLSVLAAAATGVSAWAGAAGPALVFAAVTSGAVMGSAVTRRLRLGALGGGGDLRQFERDRVMAWRYLTRAGRGERAALRARGERTYVGGQGEVVRERAWPAHTPWVPMTGDGHGRIPARQGMHLLVAGATGSGKTVSARRWLLARVLRDNCGALVSDPKGDKDLEADLRHVARLAGRPFVLIDPLAPDTARWNPVWSDQLGGVVSRLIEPLASAEGNAKYYADTLQVHLGVVVAGLHAAGLWPANMPLLLEAGHPFNYAALCAHVRGSCGADAEIVARMRAHRAFIAPDKVQEALHTSTLRLRVVTGETWRRVFEPRACADGEHRAVTLRAALRARAIVLMRSWVDDLPEEAKAITTLFLADAAAAALTVPNGAQWVALIDEFGGVLSAGGGDRALALMQRARSGGGQIALVTQSVADVEAATGNAALLDALVDNFGAMIIHRQNGATSRDWLSKTFGTRELWQTTDRTGGGGAYTDGTGSRRRVREFLVSPDTFATLDVGEAIVWSPLANAPEQVNVRHAELPQTQRPAIDANTVEEPCAPSTLPTTPATTNDTAAPPESPSAQSSRARSPRPVEPPTPEQLEQLEQLGAQRGRAYKAPATRKQAQARIRQILGTDVADTAGQESEDEIEAPADAPTTHELVDPLNDNISPDNIADGGERPAEPEQREATTDHIDDPLSL